MKYFHCLVLPAFLLLPFTSLSAQTPALPSNEISADLGACSVELNVTDPDHKPVYGAKVDARVQYGPFSVKKLDLEAFTDANGRLTISHLPATLKKPLIIYITRADKGQIVEFKPETHCQAHFDVVLY
jgi:hypothetical protein